MSDVRIFKVTSTCRCSAGSSCHNQRGVIVVAGALVKASLPSVASWHERRYGRQAFSNSARAFLKQFSTCRCQRQVVHADDALSRARKRRVVARMCSAWPQENAGDRVRAALQRSMKRAKSCRSHPQTGIAKAFSNQSAVSGDPQTSSDDRLRQHGRAAAKKQRRAAAREIRHVSCR